MARRHSSLSISTILKKAQKQGASAFTLDLLLTRLHGLSKQKPDRITDDAPINVDAMLRNGIRLHPFLIQNDPITPDQMEDLSLPSPQDRRRLEEGRMLEDLELPGREGPARPLTGDEELGFTESIAFTEDEIGV